MWRRVDFFSSMFVYLAHLHIYSLKPKDLEPAHCHALCSSKRETGGLAMQSEGEIIPQIALAIGSYFSQEKNLMPRFACGALSTKDLFRIQTCWGLCWCNFALFSSKDYLGHHVDFPSIHGFQVCAWLLMQRAEAQKQDQLKDETLIPGLLANIVFKLRTSARCQANAKARDEALVLTNSQQPALEKRNTR